MTRLRLAFMVSEKYTNQKFLYVLLFHIVASHCIIITNTKLRFLRLENIENENNNAQNSTTFSNYIRNVPIEDNELMVSFDVTSLYTNIPISDTVNIINDYVNNDDQFTRKAAI